MNERVRWTQLLKSWAKKKLKGELERKINLKISSNKKNIQQNREKGDSVCVFLDMCVTVQESKKVRSENARQCEVGERCFRERELACGCVPLYPLFIHSLLSQSLGNETGDRNEDLRGGSSLTPFIFLCSFHLSL